jgi:predicted dehydrogenase
VYADVVAEARSAHPGYPTFADGHDEMLVADAIARSAREGRWVNVART